MRSFTVFGLALLVGIAVITVSCSRHEESVSIQSFTQSSKAGEVPLGGQFRIGLHGNLTTGYQWRLRDSLPSFVALRDFEHVSDPHAPGMVGYGETTYFTFEVSSRTEFDLRFEYIRPWNNDRIDSALFHIRVR